MNNPKLIPTDQSHADDESIGSGEDEASIKKSLIQRIINDDTMDINQKNVWIRLISDDKLKVRRLTDEEMCEEYQ